MIPRSHRVRFACAVGALLAALALCACGAAAPAVMTEGERLTGRTLFPLGEGYQWTYDVDGNAGPPGRTTTRVVSHSGNRWHVDDGSGTEPVVYELRPEGVFRMYGQTWLLHEPIRVGETWSSPLGGLASVMDIHASAETPAGTFSDCVTVLETGTEGEIRSVYCPNVGLVTRATTTQGPQGRVQETLRLHDRVPGPSSTR